MNRYRPPILLVVIVVLISVSILGFTWANYSYALQHPGGNDFLSRWLGTRLYLLKGQSPYSPETSLEIQKMMYGRQARPGEDQVLFVYPFYAIFIFSPFALIGNYVLARALWMTILEISLIGLTIIGLSLSRWRIPRLLLVALLLFSLLWYHGLRPVINGNAAVLCALLVALSLYCLRVNHDFVAGVLLALATMKPQMIILLIALLIFWSISTKRWQFIIGFGGAIIVMMGVCSMLIRDWILQNIQQILSYPTYTLPGTPGAIFAIWLPVLGSKLGWVLTGILTLLMLWEWRRAMRKDFRFLFWGACITLVITNLIGIRTATENYIVMMPALIFFFSQVDERWKVFGRIVVILSMLLLFFGLWALFINTIQVGDQPVQNSIMFFPLPVFLLMGLYWIRWWAIRTPKIAFEDSDILSEG